MRLGTAILGVSAAALAAAKQPHTAAKTQLRRSGPGRGYYDRKLAEGKSTMEALRVLKRQLCDVVYRQLLADHQARTIRGGQMRTSPQAA